MSGHRHCDDYIRDKSQPRCLRAFILHHRIPAVTKLKWIRRGWSQPILFARYKGKSVRVTMASRFGDVGISTDLKQAWGYSQRVAVAELKDFSAVLP